MNNLSIPAFNTSPEGEPLLDHWTLANGFGVDPRTIVAAIRRLEGIYAKLCVKSAESGIPGRPSQTYWLTEAQVMLLPSLLQATETTIEFQAQLIERFEAFRKANHPAQRFLKMSRSELFQYMTDLAKELESQANALAAAAPKVAFYDACVDATGSFRFREAAKLISEATGKKIGQNQLFAWLREKSIIQRVSTEPYQRYIDQGWFVLLIGTHDEDGVETVHSTTRLTVKGLQRVQELWKEAHSKQLEVKP